MVRYLDLLQPARAASALFFPVFPRRVPAYLAFSARLDKAMDHSEVDSSAHRISHSQQKAGLYTAPIVAPEPDRWGCWTVTSTAC